MEDGEPPDELLEPLEALLLPRRPDARARVTLGEVGPGARLDAQLVEQLAVRAHALILTSAGAADQDCGDGSV